MILANLKAICAGALPREDGRPRGYDAVAAYTDVITPSFVLAMLECLEAADVVIGCNDRMVCRTQDILDYHTKRAALNEMLRGMR